MNSVARKAWLFTATSPAEIFGGYALIDPQQDLVVAVDAGLARVHALGLKPDLIIGDMDSVDPELLALYADCEQQRHPSLKNETDTELALLWCLEAGAGDVVICNDLGGRFDHSLALIQNLENLHARGVYGRIESASQRVWFLEKDTLIKSRQGCLLSLLAWGAAAEFANSQGLQYPLAGLILKPQKARGISNRIESGEARIRLASGKILAILTMYE